VNTLVPATYALTYTATDGSGNAGTATRTVTVIDTTAPVIAPHGNETAEATGATGAIVTYTSPAWTDTVSGGGTAACVPASGSVFALGATTVTCTAADAALNSATPTTFAVRVVDTTPPVVTLNGGASITIEAGSAFTDPGATAVDLVNGSRPVTASGTVNTPVPGTYTLTYTATDASGNTGTATRAVTVVDTEPPVTLTASVSPQLLWPPNGAIVNVTVSGQVFDAGSGAARIVWSVLDEYGTHQPAGTATVTNGPYSFQVPLLQDRRGNDMDGRHFTIRLTVFDAAGNGKVLANPPVVNVHDQSEK
jgi:hypothetical protein